MGQIGQAICFTRTGARNIGQGAITAHAFVQLFVLHGPFAGHVVLIDKISFMSIDLLAYLEHLRLKGVPLLWVDDCRQLPPICNKWRGTKVPSDLFERNRRFSHSSRANYSCERGAVRANKLTLTCTPDCAT